MKLILQILLALCFTTTSYAQLQNANWCFGAGAKVGFMTTPPSVSTSAITPGTPGGYDVGSVSDQNGNLLFYTNGKVVWGKNNLIMPNGSQLYTTESDRSPQFLSIVAKPNSPNIYYLFQLVCGYANPHTLGHEGIYYSVIDMNLNNGNGDVVAGLKNIPLKNDLGQVIDYNYSTGVGLKPKYGEITSTLHRDGDKVWVSFLLTFDNANVPTRYLYSYLVTQNGIHNSIDGLCHVPDGTTLLSNANYPSPNTAPFSFGQIKVSPDGAYLCDAMFEAVNLYKFNNQTGTVIFNAQLYIDDGNGNGSGIGVEFSPNSQLLYFTTYVFIYQQGKIITPVQNRQIRIFQNRIGSSKIEAIHKMDIIESPQALFDSFPLMYNTFSLQRTIDGKIYFCSSYPAPSPPNQTLRTLGAIRQPNLISTACDVSVNEITLLSGTRHIGVLPQWVHATAGKWPKQYSGKSTDFLTKAGNGIVAFFSTPYSFNDGGNLTPNINHQGPLPSQPTTSGNFYAVHYTSTGLTNWTKTGLVPLATLHNGNILMGGFFDNSIGAVYTYHDPITGAVVSAPSLVPAGERIIAETNSGGYISISNNNMLYLHTPTGNSSGIFLTSNSAFPSLYLESYSKFNPINNKLFLYLLVNGNAVLRIYSVTNNDIFLLTEKQLLSSPNGPPQGIFVNNNDEVFTMTTNSNSQLVQIDYSGTNPIAVYNTVSIPGVVNSNMIRASNIDPYTNNTCAISKFTSTGIGTSFCDLYLLDLITFNKKTIRTTNCYANDYFLDGNEVYLGVKSQFNAIYSVGNVQVNSFNPNRYMMSVFKLNINTEFSRFTNTQPILAPENSSTKAITNSFSVVISPNPASNNIKIDITVTDKAYTNDTYTLIFKNTITNRSIVKKGYKSANAIDISNFEKGVHYVEIINRKGEKIDSKFIKL